MKKVKLSLTAEEATLLRSILQGVAGMSKQEAGRRRRLAAYKLGMVSFDGEMERKHQESVRANIAVAYKLEKQSEAIKSIEECLSFEMVNKKIKLFKK